MLENPVYFPFHLLRVIFGLCCAREKMWHVFSGTARQAYCATDCCFGEVGKKQDSPQQRVGGIEEIRDMLIIDHLLMLDSDVHLVDGTVCNHSKSS